MFSQAKELLDLGYNVLPIAPNGKKPVVPWVHLQDRRATLGEVAVWFGHGSRNNVGVVCGRTSGNLFVKDFDTKEGAREFYKARKAVLRTVVETRKGAHFWFRRPGARNSQGDKQDGRGHGGYVVSPPSVVDAWTYSFVEGHGLVRPEELPELCEDVPVASITRDTVRRVEAYLAKVESIQGKRGSAGLVRAGSVCRDAGVGEAEALAALIVWNQSPSVSPAWSLKELARAVSRVYARGATNARND